MQVAREANSLLRFIIQSEIWSREAGAHTSAHDGVDSFDIDASVRSVLALIKKKRAGWLAHWEAACYFSRAAMAAGVTCPRNWRKIERRWRRYGSLGFPYAAGESRNWRECCEAMAIGEIGRVLRNPCNQLNPELLQTDPDMKRLHEALGNEMVRALIGPMPDHEPIQHQVPVRDDVAIRARLPIGGM